MSIEGGARCGYVNPDETTIAYLRGPPVRAAGRGLRARGGVAGARWRAMPAPRYDDRVEIDGRRLAPSVTWGINPGQSVGVDERLPEPALDADRRARARSRRPTTTWACAPGEPIAGTPDRRRLHRLLHERAHLATCARPRASRARAGWRRACARSSCRARRRSRRQAEAEGLDEVFRAAGFEWREAGCSMCLAMNPDKLVGRELCASSSNRNFKGRQGSPTGRTLLMSPAMVAAAALRGRGQRRAGDPLMASAAAARASRGTRLRAARRRHRHRPHHPGALPALRGLRRARRARLRGRPPAGEGRPPARRRALRGRLDPDRGPQLRLRLLARARAAGADAPRLPRLRRRAPSPRSSRATASRSGLPCVDARAGRSRAADGRGVGSTRSRRWCWISRARTRQPTARGRLAATHPRRRARASCSRAPGTPPRCCSKPATGIEQTAAPPPLRKQPNRVSASRGARPFRGAGSNTSTGSGDAG